ncbi:MAG TPA: chemotaxis protein CheX [Sedimentisphaerales bacterium]|nr:chemotaxis protein CheX [Sedimentisphaerales bacterium]
MIEQICISDALLDGAKEVFETMIFMEMEQTAEEMPNDNSDALLGSITFKGNIEGMLSIYCSADCAKAIAANMLGLDINDSISHEDINDAIGEVSNMVMGSLKSRIQDTIPNIDVSIPSVVTGQNLQTTMSDSLTKAEVNVCLEEEYFAKFSFLYREKNV